MKCTFSNNGDPEWCFACYDILTLGKVTPFRGSMAPPQCYEGKLELCMLSSTKNPTAASHRDRYIPPSDTANINVLLGPKIKFYLEYFWSW